MKEDYFYNMEYEAVVEAVLFASGNSVAAGDIALAIDTDEETARNIALGLQHKYNEEKRGFCIIEVDGRFQMCSNPIYIDYIRKLFELPNKNVLSPALLETLAIIAYKQPVTKAQIENIRGVNADYAVNSLMKYKLVMEKGRLDVPGKPILFGTTEDFLKHYGFNSLSQLPELESETELEENEATIQND